MDVSTSHRFPSDQIPMEMAPVLRWPTTRAAYRVSQFTTRVRGSGIMSWFKPDVRQLRLRGDVKGLLKATQYRGPDAPSVREDAWKALAQKVIPQDRDLIPKLVDLMNKGGIDAPSAAKVLALIDKRIACDAIVSCIGDLRYVRPALIGVLIEAADARAYDVALRCLAIEDMHEKGPIIWLLERLDDPRVVPFLTEYLSSGEVKSNSDLERWVKGALKSHGVITETQEERLNQFAKALNGVAAGTEHAYVVEDMAAELGEPAIPEIKKRLEQPFHGSQGRAWTCPLF